MGAGGSFDYSAWSFSSKKPLFTPRGQIYVNKIIEHTEDDDYDEEDSFKEGKFATNAYEKFRGEAGEQDNLGTWQTTWQSNGTTEIFIFQSCSISLLLFREFTFVGELVPSTSVQGAL